MTNLQQQKIQWLSRAESASQKLLAVQAFRKRQSLLFGEHEEFQLMQTASLLNIQKEILCQIEAVPDMCLQTILIRRYLNGETMEQIAEAMSYDVRTVQRKHLLALDSLALPISETTIFPDISCEN